MSRFIHRVGGIILMVVTAMALSAGAEVPNRSPEKLRQWSTHIVVGKLRAVYHAAELDEHSHRNGVAEIVIDSIEKGDGLSEGQVMYARFWRRVTKPGAPPQTAASGHDVPPQGSVVRGYLKRGDDGGYDVLLPNGLQELDAAEQ